MIAVSSMFYPAGEPHIEWINAPESGAVVTAGDVRDFNGLGCVVAADRAARNAGRHVRWFIFKDPVTDIGGEKKSAKGFLAVDHDLKLHEGVDLDAVRHCAFEEVMRDGGLRRYETLAQIRERVRK